MGRDGKRGAEDERGPPSDEADVDRFDVQDELHKVDPEGCLDGEAREALLSEEPRLALNVLAEYDRGRGSNRKNPSACLVSILRSHKQRLDGRFDADAGLDDETMALRRTLEEMLEQFPKLDDTAKQAIMLEQDMSKAMHVLSTLLGDMSTVRNPSAFIMAELRRPTRSTPPTKARRVDESVEVCKEFERGVCARGDRCKFSHELGYDHRRTNFYEAPRTNFYEAVKIDAKNNKDRAKGSKARPSQDSAKGSKARPSQEQLSYDSKESLLNMAKVEPHAREFLADLTETQQVEILTDMIELIKSDRIREPTGYIISRSKSMRERDSTNPPKKPAKRRRERPNKIRETPQERPRQQERPQTSRERLRQQDNSYARGRLYKRLDQRARDALRDISQVDAEKLMEDLEPKFQRGEIRKPSAVVHAACRKMDSYGRDHEEADRDEPWECLSCGFINNPINIFCGGNGPMGCKERRQSRRPQFSDVNAMEIRHARQFSRPREEDEPEDWASQDDEKGSDSPKAGHSEDEPEVEQDVESPGAEPQELEAVGERQTTAASSTGYSDRSAPHEDASQQRAQEDVWRPSGLQEESLSKVDLESKSGLESWLQQLDHGKGNFLQYKESLASNYDSLQQIIDVYWDKKTSSLDDGFCEDLGVKMIGHKRMFKKWFQDNLSCPCEP